jgi:hypothetical protein
VLTCIGQRTRCINMLLFDGTPCKIYESGVAQHESLSIKDS